MKSFASAIIFEQQRFGHHRQKEKRYQTYKRRLDIEIHDSHERRVEHQHEQPERGTYRPANQQLAGHTTSRPPRAKQGVGAKLYRESQSSRNEHSVVLIHRPEIRPQDNGGDDDESGRDPRKEAERPLFSHRRDFRSSSSRFCAAEILRYML